MSFRIITDSSSDIPQETAGKWDISVIPLHVLFGEKEYLDGVSLKPHQFFKKLVEGGELPRTSQVTPFEFEQEFQKAVDAGQDVLCITMSSGVSGTCQSALAAAEKFGSRVIVIDSRQFCISLYVLVEYAVRCRDEGMSLQEAAAAVEKAKKRVHVISVFATLEYLKLGGRLSAAAAFAGGLLSIKPVITINKGLVEVVSRARGSKKANAMMVDFIKNAGGIDHRMPCCLGYTGFSVDVLWKYIEENAAAYKEAVRNLPVIAVGATIGTYTGPGAVALAFFGRT